MSADELRAPLVKAFERLRDDLALGEVYGDPHLALTVLLYPDEVPRIVAITERGAHAFEHLITRSVGEADESHSKRGRFFTPEELGEAHAALSAADYAIHSFRWRKDGASLGQHITEEVASRVERRRAAPIERALAEAAYEDRMKWKCDGCGNRYGTERGLHMHQSRTIRTVCKEALAARVGPQEV